VAKLTQADRYPPTRYSYAGASSVTSSFGFDIVIIDNLGRHKGKTVRALIRSAGTKLFLLPKYSPDLNPITPL
jgi:hypothetical protein